MLRKKNNNITDDQFLKALKECYGIFSLTARKIEETYKISYTRQAVYDRCKKFNVELEQIRQAALDDAEAVLKSFIFDKTTDKRLRLDAVKFFLETIGKRRGYLKSNELLLNDKKSFNITFNDNVDGKPNES